MPTPLYENLKSIPEAERYLTGDHRTVEIFLDHVVEELLAHSDQPAGEVLETLHEVLQLKGGVWYDVVEQCLVLPSKEKIPLQKTQHMMLLFLLRQGYEKKVEQQEKPLSIPFTEYADYFEKGEKSKGDLKSNFTQHATRLKEKLREAGIFVSPDFLYYREEAIFAHLGELLEEPEIIDEVSFLYWAAYQVFTRITAFPDNTAYDLEKLVFFQLWQQSEEGAVASLKRLTPMQHVVFLRMLMLKKNEYFSPDHRRNSSEVSGTLSVEKRRASFFFKNAHGVILYHPRQNMLVSSTGKNLMLTENEERIVQALLSEEYKLGNSINTLLNLPYEEVYSDLREMREKILQHLSIGVPSEFFVNKKALPKHLREKRQLSSVWGFPDGSLLVYSKIGRIYHSNFHYQNLTQQENLVFKYLESKKGEVVAQDEIVQELQLPSQDVLQHVIAAIRHKIAKLISQALPPTQQQSETLRDELITTIYKTTTTKGGYVLRMVPKSVYDEYSS